MSYIWNLHTETKLTVFRSALTYCFFESGEMLTVFLISLDCETETSPKFSLEATVARRRVSDASGSGEASKCKEKSQVV